MLWPSTAFVPTSPRLEGCQNGKPKYQLFRNGRVPLFSNSTHEGQRGVACSPKYCRNDTTNFAMPTGKQVISSNIAFPLLQCVNNEWYLTIYTRYRNYHEEVRTLVTRASGGHCSQVQYRHSIEHAAKQDPLQGPLEQLLSTSAYRYNLLYRQVVRYE